ncbi:hypothetical protein CDCA_CDCA06G1962 [Cyanidium caldarium]|uniref:Uncharacterized protein n=1 Tax=Cyanidium caldarium TaxID=2771 RepID=A0AAV9IUD0_CYACA|nr:hypothetical protein CDCA_CDCA06G1962 [Cyanidium caldarium]
MNASFADAPRRESGSGPRARLSLELGTAQRVSVSALDDVSRPPSDALHCPPGRVPVDAEASGEAPAETPEAAAVNGDANARAPTPPAHAEDRTSQQALTDENESPNRIGLLDIDQSWTLYPAAAAVDNSPLKAPPSPPVRATAAALIEVTTEMAEEHATPDVPPGERSALAATNQLTAGADDGGDTTGLEAFPAQEASYTLAERPEAQVERSASVDTADQSRERRSSRQRDRLLFQGLQAKIDSLLVEKRELLDEISDLRARMSRRIRQLELDLEEAKISRGEAEARAERLEQWRRAEQHRRQVETAPTALPACPVDNEWAAELSRTEELPRGPGQDDGASQLGQTSLSGADVEGIASTPRSSVSHIDSDVRQIVVRELHDQNRYANMRKAWQSVFRPLGNLVDRRMFGDAVVRVLRQHWLTDKRVSDAQRLTGTFPAPSAEVIDRLWLSIVGRREANMQWREFVRFYSSGAESLE